MDSSVLFFCRKVFVHAVQASTAFVISATYTNVTGSCPDKEAGMKEIRKSLTSEYCKVISYRLTELAGSLRSLSEGIAEGVRRKDSLDITDMNMVFEDLSHNVCYSCERSNICWQQEYDISYNAVCEMMSECMDTGKLETEALPEHFNENCLYKKMMVTEANRSLKLARLKLSWHNNLMESREAVAGQLREMADIIAEYKTASGFDDEGYELRLHLIRGRMRMLGVRVRRSYIIRNKSGHIEIHLEARSRRGSCITMKEAATALGKALNLKLAPREDSRRVITDVYRRIIFCEDTNFKIMCGVSRISGIEGEPSGDNYSFIKTRRGNLIMLLSDGMGMGREAYGESERVIELLEQLLEAGIGEESALRLVNSVLVLKSDRLMFSTVDLCAVNLYSGTCRTIKLGAAVTFIKRGDEVDIIDSSSLPAGVRNTTDCDITGHKLYDGDYIIMLSDGVLDSVEDLEKVERLRTIIREIKVKNPQEMAKELLMSALAQNNYSPKDDMTVLVTGIWEK